MDHGQRIFDWGEFYSQISVLISCYAGFILDPVFAADDYAFEAICFKIDNT